MIVANLSEFRANMARYIEKVLDDRDKLIVTRRNREPVVVMPLSEWEGMQETLHLLSSPANAERLRASMAEAEAGRLIERELIEP
ncbi:type II toxin-antitoxin system prevent-host-death family antitoxin [Mesorhizobium sp. YIM 152430]|uniref:type II toxin-antitoxin system Phd/YefM family antitoxin n=1 Tax=Mesorhizobium sp. YIM 152430 TaxID=3031761 RepID=UPI0023DC3C15|nr:type II toxin-antitoxin system prevent-host-death family antitoxin [Mesorhizobium sp. YIM 152430]MDF1599561.1 type II toxin-antitoxin system prevent-host-death family antitoxin [Mesorhizobium sp. YIM 152430]